MLTTKRSFIGILTLLVAFMAKAAMANACLVVPLAVYEEASTAATDGPYVSPIMVAVIAPQDATWDSHHHSHDRDEADEGETPVSSATPKPSNGAGLSEHQGEADYLHVDAILSMPPQAWMLLALFHPNTSRLLPAHGQDQLRPPAFV